MMDRLPTNDDGFTVVEALVAIAIVAAMTGAMFQVIATNASTARAVTERRLALLVAQSVIDLAIVQGTRSRAAERGSTAGMTWVATSQPHGSDGFGGNLRTEHLQVSVWNRNNPSPLVTLKTLAVQP
jgi:type II secretion system protein I